MSDRFGDKDPLDAWDDADPLEAKLAVLVALVALDHITTGQRDEGLRLLLKLNRLRARLSERLDDVRDSLESI